MQKGKGGRSEKEEGGKRRKVGKGVRWAKEEHAMGMGLEGQGVQK